MSADNSPSALAHLIRSRRIVRGMSQARLGARVDRTATTVRRWERGESIPTDDLLDGLAEALEVPRAEIDAALAASLSEPEPEPELPDEPAPAELEAGAAVVTALPERGPLGAEEDVEEDDGDDDEAPVEPAPAALLPFAPPPAAEPDRSAVEPARSAAEPDRSAAVPDRSAVAPDRSAVEPDRSAVEPDRSAFEPARSAVEPARSAPEPGVVEAPPAPAAAPLLVSAAEMGVAAADVLDAGAEADVVVTDAAESVGSEALPWIDVPTETILAPPKPQLDGERPAAEAEVEAPEPTQPTAPPVHRRPAAQAATTPAAAPMMIIDKSYIEDRWQRLLYSLRLVLTVVALAVMAVILTWAAIELWDAIGAVLDLFGEQVETPDGVIDS